MKQAKQLLQQLPEKPAQLALINFDPQFYKEKLHLEEPLETPGDALRCAFDWGDSEEGYPYWVEVHENFGGRLSIEN